MLKFTPDYLLAINCQALADDRINHHYSKSVVNFSVEPFDFGSNIVYVENLENPEELRILLSELLMPNYRLCHSIKITFNKEYLLKRSNEKSKMFDKDSTWMKNFRIVLNEFKDIEIVYSN